VDGDGSIRTFDRTREDLVCQVLETRLEAL
jgi:hypothetical protein